MTRRVLSLLHRLALELRQHVLTGQRWRRPARVCPSWCLRGHHCTAGWRAGGEHRSAPAVWRTPAGHAVVVVGYQDGATGRRSVELRTRIALDADTAVQAAVTTVMAIER